MKLARGKISFSIRLAAFQASGGAYTLNPVPCAWNLDSGLRLEVGGVAIVEIRKREIRMAKTNSKFLMLQSDFA
jgi:hypothetical protein